MALRVAGQWRLLLENLRQEAHQLNLARQTLALAEIASAEPELRQLYPFTSHWSLHFTSRPAPGSRTHGTCRSSIH
ncbi:DUF6193 family natural product biosynthesis protein [Streptomyces sp. NPDC001840]